MPRKSSLPHVKRVTDRYGKVRLYFDTGTKNGRGKTVYKRMPSIDDPSWGNVYAALKAARTRRENIVPELTVRALIRLYELSPHFSKLSAGSQEVYSLYLGQLADLFDDAPAGGLERRDIYRMMDMRADRPGAANMLLVVCRNLYAWARKREHVTIDPTDGVEAFPSTEYEPWPDDLLSAALAHENLKIALPVALMYYTAQRIGDVINLRWSDIRDNVIHLTQQKTGKEMTVPVHKELQAFLDRTPRNGLTILANTKGGVAKDGTIRERLKAWAKEQGHQIVPHGLRKNAVNALLEMECSVGEVSAISGQSLGLVEHYAKRRNTGKMASAAILKWERNSR